jgi:hypothetical protein
VARNAHVAQLIGLAAAGALGVVGHVGIGQEEMRRETAILQPIDGRGQPRALPLYGGGARRAGVQGGEPRRMVHR